jgi:hypothetical protein
MNETKGYKCAVAEDVVQRWASDSGIGGWSNKELVFSADNVYTFNDGYEYFKYADLDNPFEKAMGLGVTYTIEWNGIPYTCVVKEHYHAMSGYTFYYLGNGSLSYGVEDTGEPFVFTERSTNPEYTQLRTSASEPEYINVAVYVEDIHKIDAKFLPKAEAVADVTAAPTAENFNALLASLRAAGYLSE